MAKRSLKGEGSGYQRKVVQGNELTVAEHLNDWLESIKFGKPHLRSFIEKEETVRDHLIPAIGSVKLQKLTKYHVKRMMAQTVSSYLAEARREGIPLTPRNQYSTSTLTNIRDVLQKALDYGMDLELVDRNVATLTEMPKEPNYVLGSTPWFTFREIIPPNSHDESENDVIALQEFKSYYKELTAEIDQ